MEKKGDARWMGPPQRLNANMFPSSLMASHDGWLLRKLFVLPLSPQLSIIPSDRTFRYRRSTFVRNKTIFPSFRNISLLVFSFHRLHCHSAPPTGVTQHVPYLDSRRFDAITHDVCKDDQPVHIDRFIERSNRILRQHYQFRLQVQSGFPHAGRNLANRMLASDNGTFFNHVRPPANTSSLDSNILHPSREPPPPAHYSEPLDEDVEIAEDSEQEDDDSGKENVGKKKQRERREREHEREDDVCAETEGLLHIATCLPREGEAGWR